MVGILPLALMKQRKDRKEDKKRKRKAQSIAMTPLASAEVMKKGGKVSKAKKKKGSAPHNRLY